MDIWSGLELLLGSLLGAHLHRVGLLLSMAANLVAIAGTLYALRRWWTRPQRHKKVASALRDEASYRAQTHHHQRAMELYDLSIRLNPRAAHVYFLRGCQLERLGQIDRAIADWERCVKRADHAGAREKLRQIGVDKSGVPTWAITVGAGTATAVVFALAGALMF